MVELIIYLGRAFLWEEKARNKEVILQKIALNIKSKIIREYFRKILDVTKTLSRLWVRGLS